MSQAITFAMERILSTRKRIIFVTEIIFLERKGPIGGGKRTFLEPDRLFERQKRLFIGRMNRFGCGIDPFCDPIGPPDDKIPPFGDANDSGRYTQRFGICARLSGRYTQRFGIYTRLSGRYAQRFGIYTRLSGEHTLFIVK